LPICHTQLTLTMKKAPVSCQRRELPRYHSDYWPGGQSPRSRGRRHAARPQATPLFQRRAGPGNGGPAVPVRSAFPGGIGRGHAGRTAGALSACGAPLWRRPSIRLRPRHRHVPL